MWPRGDGRDDLSVELETKKLWPLASCSFALAPLHASGTAVPVCGSDLWFSVSGGDFLSMCMHGPPVYLVRRGHRQGKSRTRHTFEICAIVSTRECNMLSFMNTLRAGSISLVNWR